MKMQSDVARMPVAEDVDNQSSASDHDEVYSECSDLGKSSGSGESDDEPGEDEDSSKEEDSGMEADSAGVKDLTAQDLEEEKEYEARGQGM